LRLRAHRFETAYDSLFDHSPFMLIEQDWSDVLEWLESLRSSGVHNIEEYLRKNPETLPWSWGLVKHLKMNPEAHALDPSPDVADPGKLSAESLEGHQDTLVDFFNGRYHRTVTFPMADDRGKVHWHHVSSFPLDPERPGRMIVAAADVTVLREAKEELEELVRSKNRFIAAISHELRTPMTAVLGFAAELRQHPAELNAEERGELLDLVLQQAQEASNIIEDLLVAARADMSAVSTIHSRVDVRREVEQVLAIYQDAAELVCPEELPPVCADAARVRQIVRNLLTNAIRHGGPERRIVCSADCDVVLIEMRDDGDILSPDEMDALFEPYTRGYEAIGMTESIGIGLTVSRHLAGLMGGSLTGHRNGHETVFRLTLPVVGNCPILDRGPAGQTASR
jgi:signal transduction histidine kinase